MVVVKYKETVTLLSEYLLVDGYNIIHAWPHLKALTEDNLGSAREALLEEMSNYSGYYHIQVIVIFDGMHSDNAQRTFEHYDEVEVVFTKQRESADHYIERIAEQVGREFKLTVATSDALEQLIVLSRGAARKSARELLLEVNQIKQEIRTDYIEETKKQSRNFLESQLDPEVVAWMEKLRRG